MKKPIVVPDFQIDIEGYVFLGRGCKASSGGIGWSSSPDIYYRCVSCGDLMTLNSAENSSCSCGSISIDADMGRFGSRFGDDNVLVYKKNANNASKRTESTRSA